MSMLVRQEQTTSPVHLAETRLGNYQIVNTENTVLAIGNDANELVDWASDHEFEFEEHEAIL